jgi:hypothetical protein
LFLCIQYHGPYFLPYCTYLNGIRAVDPVDNESQHANSVAWTALPTKHENTLKKDSTMEMKVKDSYVEGVKPIGLNESSWKWWD